MSNDTMAFVIPALKEERKGLLEKGNIAKLKCNVDGSLRALSSSLSDSSRECRVATFSFAYHPRSIFSKEPQ